ncbi:hypothetical protein QVD17_31178 [Tagetes erecta]|uniref:YDG domain-containing protein n=1 Tax=Tagetes erecta TaxID=13708 RepID=A0AAD8NNM6_TARER|nr:hypothetical protein QVD17_31178 [Tagetes erecta]
MELQKMTSETVIPRKRALDNSYISKLEELLKHRKLVPAIRDFPPGCGINEEEEQQQKPVKIVNKVHFETESRCIRKEIEGNKACFVSKPPAKVKFLDSTCMKVGFDQKPKVTTAIGMQRKNLDSNNRRMTSDGKDDKLKGFEHKEMVRNKSYLDSRSTSKVKYWEPSSLKEAEAKKSEVRTGNVSRKDDVMREKIKEAIRLYDEVYEQFRQENRLKPKGEKISPFNIPINVCNIVKQKLKWKHPEKVLGPVCGVEIGDKFNCRALVKMVGLHYQLQSGIDYANIKGQNVAISIVDSHRYSNESGSSEKLVYSGHGGNGAAGFKGDKGPTEDQKLEKGNLAMKNSMDKKNPLRVIKKLEGFEKNGVFVYDGLYTVDDYTRDKNEQGNIVFKFHLNRIPGQPSLYRMLNGSR